MMSKVKGEFQVREMVESSTVALRSPTAESRPIKLIYNLAIIIHIKIIGHACTRFVDHTVYTRFQSPSL